MSPEPMAPGGAAARGRGLARMLGAAGSGLLMAAAFPPREWSALAWIALVPLMLAARGAPPRRAAGLGFLCGAFFWLPNLYWITPVTVAGWIGLALYCALFPMGWTLGVAAWTRRFGVRHDLLNLALMALAALAWAGLEYLRATLFTGFPWNGLGVSQYRNLALIQAAAWGGVPAVSAAVVWVNAATALTLLSYMERRPGAWHRPRPELMLGAIVPLLLFWNGTQAWRQVPLPDATARLALIQPAIPQDQKWTPAFMDSIYARLESLSRLAQRTAPDLVVWPETAVPEDLSSPGCEAMIRRVTADGAPLLAGLLRGERDPGGAALYFNSAVLLDRAGPVQVYDKQHLVLFGEYVPLKRWLPFLSALTPFESSITPGRGPVVFHLDGSTLAFASLICFEDSFGGLSRAAVARGARLLITQTNDAWFDPTSGSRQHLAQSVFRCVENRVPMARCANTGVTAWIDARGAIRQTQPRTQEDGSPAAGFLIAEVEWNTRPAPATFYQRHADLFGQLGLLAWLLVLLLVPRRRPARTTSPL